MATPGRHERPLSVDSSQTIQGSVAAGLVIRTAQRLLVQGMVLGPVTLEAYGALEVQGAMDATEGVVNEGVIKVSGVLHGRPAEMVKPGGRLVVAAGTIINDGDRPHRIKGDGGRSYLSPGAQSPLQVDGSRSLGYFAQTDAWRPL